VKVLLVDDSAHIRQIQKHILEQMGCTDVLEAADGVEALAVLAKQRPDLVLVDWNMPNMDGLTLVRRIRQIDRTLPVIMVTAEVDKAHVVQALRAGVHNYVVKPFTAETLAEKINQTLRRLAANV